MTLHDFIRFSLALALFPFMVVGAVVAVVSYSVLVLPWLSLVDKRPDNWEWRLWR